MIFRKNQCNHQTTFYQVRKVDDLIGCVYSFTAMGKRYMTDNFILLILFVSLLTNAVAWSFHQEIFKHELDHFHVSHRFDHHHSYHDHAADTGFHQHHDETLDNDPDFTDHLILHAAGQFQPFYFILLPIIPSLPGKENIPGFFPAGIPESTLDLPFRPPRNTASLEIRY
ncbi:MAG TPA: hypothetical protein PLI91_02925 [Nitrosomonas europaea]|nr:hypothetical protein [Nitrosomonas europaea]